MPSLLPRILLWGRLLPADWWSSGVASVTPAACVYRSCRGQTTIGETAVGGVLSSLPALALHGGVASRLLAQSALQMEPVFLTWRRGDSWDAGRQTALPVA
jgi:hypothetical protein